MPLFLDPGVAWATHESPPLCTNRSDMQRWLGAFPTPGPLPCSSDTIYEDCGKYLSEEMGVGMATKKKEGPTEPVPTLPSPECSQELCAEPSTPSKPEGQSLESKGPRKHPHKNPEGEGAFHPVIQEIFIDQQEPST